MTAHQSTGVLVIERFTQDGWDWPNPNPAPVEVVPAPPRVQLLEDSYVQHSDVPVWREEKPRCPRCHLPQAECDKQRALPDPEPLF